MIKKFNLTAFLTVMVVILSVALIGVMIKSNSENNFTEENKVTEYAEEITPLKKTATELKVIKEIEMNQLNNEEAWKKAYIDFLSNYYTETNEEKIWLGYVDGDNIPELFISEGTYHYCTVEVYTFQNNIVTLLCETGSNGSVNYFERQGIICGFYFGMGCGTYWVYNINNGKTQEIYNAFTNEGFIPQEEDFNLEININGIDVSSEELDEFLDSYFSKENSTWVFDEEINSGYEIKEDEYIEYINNYF